MLDLTQAELALKVSCSLSMLKKIERDERRPSEQLAELLAGQLALAGSELETFLQLGRGIFTDYLYEPGQFNDASIPVVEEIDDYSPEKTPFVARQRELLLLNEHLSRAMSGRGRMVFIAGEAGRGKTSLLHEFARQALDARPGLIAAGGSSDVYTGQGDPLLPFRDIFRMLAGDIGNSSMREIVNRKLAVRLALAVPVVIEALLENGPHLIDTLIPGRELETRLAQSPGSPKSRMLLLRLESQLARQASTAGYELRQDHLFDELSKTLNALAVRQPMILLLDDLHWIDQSTADLLGHLAKRLQQSPILIVGSYRPEELAQRRASGEQGHHWQHPLQEPLSESLRQFGHNRIDLDNYDPGEELGFINAILDLSGNEFTETFRKELAQLTEGHPLFVVELLRDLRERGKIIQGEDGRWIASRAMSWDNIPDRVDGVIEKRVNRLPDDLRSLLAIASVQGETFYAEVVAQAAQVEARQLAGLLSTELDQRHRLIQEQGLTRAGPERLSQYRFRHHLFQKYLYEHLAPAERMYLHEAVGLALEALYAGSSSLQDFPAVQLARHFQEARLPEKTARYMLLAGQKAARVLVFDEAARRFEQGLSELEQLARTPEIRRMEYDLTLAAARALWHGGRISEAVKAAHKAIEIARTLDDPHVLAEAVLAFEEPRWRLNLEPKLSQQFMREALTALGDEQSGARVRLLVGLSRLLQGTGEQDDLRSNVEQALQIARQIEDPLALCDALRIKIHIDRRPESTGERLTAIQELVATARSINDQERLADGLGMYVFDLLELGEIEQADQMIQAQSEVTHEIKQPFQMLVAAVFQTMRAIMQGEFEKAERLAKEAADFSQQIGIADLDGIFGMHMFTIRREQGRIGEIAPVMKVLAAHSPESQTWRPGLALIYSLLGQRDECRAVFEEVAAGGFASVPRDALWASALSYLAEVCAYLEDRERAAILYRLLLPYEGRAVIAGAATVCFGAAGRFLGLLAKTLPDLDAAERHFRQAIELDKSMQAWPWLAHSRCEYAAMLLERNRAGDCERAWPMLDEARRSAGRMGMADLAEKAASLQSRFGAPNNLLMDD